MMTPVKCFRLLPIVALTACGHVASAPPAARTDASAAPGTLQAWRWDLQQVHVPGGALDESWLRGAGGLAPQITFFKDGEAGSIGVGNLCNGNHSPAQWKEDGSVAVQSGTRTLMACMEPGLMELEERIMALLPKMQRWSIQSARDGMPVNLQLEFHDGTHWWLVSAPSPLEQLSAWRWHLREAFTDGSPDASWLRGAAGQPPQLDVDKQGNLHIKNLCKPEQRPASWKVDGSVRVAEGASSAAACGDAALMALESRVGKTFSALQRWSIQPARNGQPAHLTLRFADGTRWLLEGRAR